MGAYKSLDTIEGASGVVAEAMILARETIAEKGEIVTKALLFLRKNPASGQWFDTPQLSELGAYQDGGTPVLLRRALEQTVEKGDACGIVLGSMGWAESESGVKQRVVMINFAHEKLEGERIIMASVYERSMGRFNEHTAIDGYLTTLLKRKKT